MSEKKKLFLEATETSMRGEYPFLIRCNREPFHTLVEFGDKNSLIKLTLIYDVTGKSVKMRRS